MKRKKKARHGKTREHAKTRETTLTRAIFPVGFCSFISLFDVVRWRVFFVGGELVDWGCCHVNMAHTEYIGMI
jgi:hypothetical protein